MGNTKSINIKKACCCISNIIPGLSYREIDKGVYKSIPNSSLDSHKQIKETQLTFLSSSEASTATSSRAVSQVKAGKDIQADKLLKESLMDDGEHQENIKQSYTPSTPKKMDRESEYVSPPMSEEKLQMDTSLVISDEDVKADKTFIYLNEWQENISKLCEEKTNEITNLAQQPYDGFDLIYKEEKAPHNLQLYMKSYVSSENFRVNIIRAEYISPSDPETYMRFMNNIIEQAKLDPNIEVSIEEEKFHENNFVFYIRYKKILFLSQRDFVYAKNFRCLDPQKNMWADCAVSISYDKYPAIENIVRGNVVKSGHFVEEIESSEPGKRACKVKLYSEIDLKLNVPVFVSRPATINEMRKYVEKCSNRLEAIMLEKN